MRLHHVGIATSDAGATAERFAVTLDTHESHVEEVDGLAVRFLACDGMYLELLEPIEEGTVSRFLERDGPGLHHLAFETDDITRRLREAAAAGVDLIDETPRPGAWGHEVAFLHPAEMGGVLVEYVATDG